MSRWIAGVCLAGLLFSGCAMTPTSDPGARDGELIEVIEQLHLSQKAAEAAFRELRDLAEGYLGQSDGQLNHYQKIYLHLRHANQICRSQWELFAIVNYIRPDARTDYFTLRVQDLKRAVFETETVLKTLDIYRAFLANPGAAVLVDKAVGTVETHLYLYEKLLDRCRPLARQGSLDGQ